MNPYVTRMIKSVCTTVYVRMAKQGSRLPSKPVALLAPARVVKRVMEEARATEARREQQRQVAREARRRRESRRQDEIVTQVDRLYPSMPKGEARMIVTHAFAVGSGRVGRAGDLSLAEQVALAVCAHIRHAHTRYDLLFERGHDRESARESVSGEVERIHQQWQSPPNPTTGRADEREASEVPRAGAG